MAFIIDGYNLLHSIQTTGTPEPVTDVGLCKILDRYLKIICGNGQIIFDGIGPPDKTGFQNTSILEVIFSGPTTEADHIIENKIQASSAPKSLLIVSDDRRIRKAAQARKAPCLRCRPFFRNVQKQLNRQKRPNEPPEKRLGLTEGETQKWLDFFNLNQ